MARNDVLHLLLAFLIGALSLMLAPCARGAACAVNAHAIVYPSTTQVYQQQQQTYQAVAVAVPLYSASAPGLSPEVILLLQQITESIKQTNALIESHEARLAVVERGGNQGLVPAPQAEPPARRGAPAGPPAMPQAAPESAAPPVGGSPRLFASSCVKCHDAGSASAKGGGFALLSGGKELPLTVYQMLEMQDRLTLDPTSPKYMPKGNVPAAEEDVEEVVVHLKQLAKARK